MRLVQKLSLAFMVGTTAILAANGYFRVRREVTLFQADRVRDHELIGRTLRASVAGVWRSEGEADAMRLIDAASSGESRVRLRWVWLEGDGAARGVRVAPAELARLAPGSMITRIAPDDHGEDERYTYVPMSEAGRAGALELSEGLDAERSYTRRTIVETVGTTALLALVTTLLSYLLGSWLVGRPIRALVEKARRIGRGDFAEPVRLASTDELSEVAREMNATSDALGSAIEQLRHADRLTTVGKLASGVAHELGTPLNVVVARAEMIAAGDATADESREYARIIVDSAQKMTRIIRQLLEFARRRGPRKERRDVTGVAQHTLELLRPLADRQHVALALESGGPQETNVDAVQIEQALTNLVVNAVQAMPGGGTVEVSVGRERARPPPDHGATEGEWVAVRVRDTGEGIAPEHLPHVFEPFFTTKDVGSGTGLGLSVAYGIVRDHGGWIDVASRPESGTTFSLFLPVQGPS
ncbi:MAG TPA: HAMP domain-containing sensor histidine kinase [Polyangiaceae bacterium]|jgi:signal transduction histidine kinase